MRVTLCFPRRVCWKETHCTSLLGQRAVASFSWFSPFFSAAASARVAGATVQPQTTSSMFERYIFRFQFPSLHSCHSSLSPQVLDSPRRCRERNVRILRSSLHYRAVIITKEQIFSPFFFFFLFFLLSRYEVMFQNPLHSGQSSMHASEHSSQSSHKSEASARSGKDTPVFSSIRSRDSVSEKTN